MFWTSCCSGRYTSAIDEGIERDCDGVIGDFSFSEGPHVDRYPPFAAAGDVMSRRRTTAFTCRAGGKELDLSENRDAGPVKCNALFGGPWYAFIGRTPRPLPQAILRMQYLRHCP